jgi:hypothetical protein
VTSGTQIGRKGNEPQPPVPNWESMEVQRADVAIGFLLYDTDIFRYFKEKSLSKGESRAVF